MPVNLLKWARGVQDELFKALVLDDAGQTINRELRALRGCGIGNKLESDASTFLLALDDWLHYRDEASPEDQAEMSVLLVVDVNLPNLLNIRTLMDVVSIPALEQLDDEYLETAAGRRAGMVLVDAVLRHEQRYRKLPIIVISGFGTIGVEERLQHVQDLDNTGPVAYVDKIATDSKTKRPVAFKRVAEEFVHDKRLYFVQRLCDYWRLEEEQICRIMGMRQARAQHLAELFDRGRPSHTFDHDNRYRALKRIQRRLSNLVHSRSAEIEWLHTPFSGLGDQKPIDMLTSRDSKNFYSVEGFLNFLAGW